MKDVAPSLDSLDGQYEDTGKQRWPCVPQPPIPSSSGAPAKRRAQHDLT